MDFMISFLIIHAYIFYCNYFLLLIMTYMGSVWLFFPVYQIDLENQQLFNQSMNQSMQPCTSAPLNFDKQKWDCYLDIFRAYLKKKSKKTSKKLWKKQEDDLLIDLRQRGLSWDEISQVMKSRNPKICQRRYQRLNQILLKWPQELDLMIKHLVEEKDQDWGQIHQILYSSESLRFPKHSAKQVKERYLLNLKPGIIVQEWNIQEDIALLKIIREKGTHWRKLSEEFQGRTQLQLKNRYYGILKPLQRKVLRKINSKMKQLRSNSNISQ